MRNHPETFPSFQLLFGTWKNQPFKCPMILKKLPLLFWEVYLSRKEPLLFTNHRWSYQRDWNIRSGFRVEVLIVPWMQYVWQVDFRELEMSPCQIRHTKRWWGLDYTTKFQRSCVGGAQKLPVVSGFGFDVTCWRWVLMSGFSSMISHGRTSENWWNIMPIFNADLDFWKGKHPKSSL